MKTWDDAMTASSDKETQKWVETWKFAAFSLERLRREKIRDFDYLKNLDAVDQMLQWACENKKSRPITGLVVQQQYFMKIGKYGSSPT